MERVFRRLQEGWLKEYQHKILYVSHGLINYLDSHESKMLSPKKIDLLRDFAAGDYQSL